MKVTNKKGFTLIELLAVIVILAVLILLAIPSVLRLMDTARKNAFFVEAGTVINGAKMAYAEEAIMQASSNRCFPLTHLVNKGYLDKTLTNYNGSVLVTINNNVAEYKVWMSNGTYSLSAATSKIIGDKKPENITETATAASNNCGGQGTAP